MQTRSKHLVAVASMSALHLEKPSILMEAIDSAGPKGGDCLWRFGIVIQWNAVKIQHVEPFILHLLFIYCQLLFFSIGK